MTTVQSPSSRQQIVMIHPKMLWRAWAWTKWQKPSSEHPSQVLVYMKSSGHSTKQPTSTGFPKRTVHEVLLKMSWWCFKIWESSVLLELCLADVMLTFLILQSPLQPTLMWESCSLGWKGTRTKLEGPFSQYSFMMYVWQLAVQTFLTHH